MKKIISILLATFFVIFFGVGCHASSNREKAISNINKQLPKTMLGGAVVWDKAYCSNGMIYFSYYFTVDVKKSDVGDSASQMKNGMVVTIRYSDELREFVENGNGIKYTFNDKNGNYLFSFLIDKSDL